MASRSSILPHLTFPAHQPDSALGFMASVAATVSVHLFGGGTDPGYGALQRLQAAPAATARPVLLVHGFGGTKSSWSQLARTLSARGVTFDAITYAPFGTSIEQLADRLAVEVKRMLSQTGADRLHLVGHSLGGVGIAQAQAVASPGRSTRSLPSGHRSGGRRGRNCCRSGRLSGRCGKVRHYCDDWPPRRHPTVCGGWHLRLHSIWSCPAAVRCRRTRTRRP